MLTEILKKKTIGSRKLTVAQKKLLFSLFEEYGMTLSTCYHRFYEKGFDQWEIDGVTATQNAFLSVTPCYNNNDTSIDGTTGYVYALTLADGYDDSKFYELITRYHLGSRFCYYMSDRGMKSHVTVRKRFCNYDFKPWELIGVRKMLEIFDQRIAEGCDKQFSNED